MHRTQGLRICVALFVMLAFSSAYAQKCTRADWAYARTLVHHFIEDLRTTPLESLRPTYFTSTCQPAFHEFFAIDKKLKAELSCDELKSVGDASFEVTFLVFEMLLRSEKFPPEGDGQPFSLKLLPRNIAEKFKTDPILSMMLENDAVLRTREDVEHYVSGMRDVAAMARTYIKAHPETDALADSRRKELAEADGPGTNCGQVDDSKYFGYPKWTPYVVTGESMFVFVLFRENGQWRISRIDPRSH